MLCGAVRGRDTDADGVELPEPKKMFRLLEQETRSCDVRLPICPRRNLPGNESSRSFVRWPRPAPESGCRSRCMQGPGERP